jgi:phosphopantetheinyl transferase (holo-ACP synthase)
MTQCSVIWYIGEIHFWDGIEKPCRSKVARRIANALYCRSQATTLSEPIRIVSRDSRNRSRRPIAWLGTQRLRGHFSISHGDRFVAVAHSHSRRIGIDVVDQQTISERALHWALSPTEQKWIQSDPFRIRQIWSAKEAAFKASRLRKFYPRQVEIHDCDESPFAVVGSLKIGIQWLTLESASVSLASSDPCTWTRIDNLL